MSDLDDFTAQLNSGDDNGQTPAASSEQAQLQEMLAKMTPE